MSEKKQRLEISELIKVEGIDCKGFGIIAKLITTDADLDIGAKALYAYLCSYAGNGTTAYPRRSKILADLKMCKDAYYKYQKQLIENGYIKAERTDTYPFPNIYTIVSRPSKLKNIPNGENESGDILVVRGIKSLGYGTVPKAVMLDKRLHYKAKALYAYFCSFAGNGTTAIPTRDTITYHLNISINSFQKYIRQLIQFNYIEVSQSKKNGRFANNIYYLNDLPDEEIGQKEIERREAVQEKKAQKASGQAVYKEDNTLVEQGGVNIDTPIENIENSSNNDDFISEKEEKSSSFVQPQKQSSYDEERIEAERIMEERAIYTEVIKDNIEYDIFAADSNYGDLKEVVLNIMLDTITSRASFIKINGSDIPKEVVKSRLLKLNHENIEYVMDKLLSSTSEIVNIPRYILTALYNSQTESFYWHNQVKKDGII